MSRFPSAGHLIAWAGLCPGQNESAGKRKSSRLRKGAPWLKTMLVQCAWAASRKKESYYKAQFNRLKSRRGPKKAACAVAPAHGNLSHPERWRRTSGPRGRLSRPPFHRRQDQAPARPTRQARLPCRVEIPRRGSVSVQRAKKPPFRRLGRLTRPLCFLLGFCIGAEAHCHEADCAFRPLRP